MRYRALLALGAAALLLAGCSGGKTDSVAGPTSGAASIAPAASELFISLLTDFDSDQWKTLERLADKFPSLRTALDSPDFVQGRDALGAETGVVFLDLQNTGGEQTIALTQPKDEAKLRSLLERDENPPVVEEIEGWQVISDLRDMIDRFKSARNDGALADDESYKAAVEGLPASRLLTMFIPGAPIAEAYEDATQATSERVPGIGNIGWLAAAAHVRDEGFAVDFRVKGDELDAEPFAATLLDEVPAGALAVMSFKGVDEALREALGNPAVEERIGQGAEFLGETLDKVIALFENEAVAYMRPSVPTPEVTLALRTDDEAGALAVVDELLTKVGASLPAPPETVVVDGLDVRKLTMDESPLYITAFDGKLVLTSSEAGITSLRDGGATLSDDAIYTAATDAAELPDETAGSLYVNLPALIPLLTALSPENPATREALTQAGLLGPLVAYARVEAAIVSARLFLSVK